MRNKYNYNELVNVNGTGRIYGKVKNKLGLIIDKDTFYNDYYINLFFGKKDWYKENSISRVFKEKKNKSHTYQIRLCTTRNGLELIKDNLKNKGPISNNKINQINYKKSFYNDGKEYMIIGWKSIFWPISNKSVQIIEDTIRNFRSLDIPVQYIKMNEDIPKDIEINEFIENDSNVDVFSIERKIKMKKILKDHILNGRKDKYDCRKSIADYVSTWTNNKR